MRSELLVTVGITRERALHLTGVASSTVWRRIVPTAACATSCSARSSGRCRGRGPARLPRLGPRGSRHRVRPSSAATWCGRWPRAWHGAPLCATSRPTSPAEVYCVSSAQRIGKRPFTKSLRNLKVESCSIIKVSKSGARSYELMMLRGATVVILPQWSRGSSGIRRSSMAARAGSMVDSLPVQVK